MTTKKYASDLHRKGELNKVDAMEKLAIKITKKSNDNLASAFITEAYHGSDCFAIMANSARWQDKTGYVLYDEEQQKAVFVPDEE